MKEKHTDTQHEPHVYQSGYVNGEAVDDRVLDIQDIGSLKPGYNQESQVNIRCGHGNYNISPSRYQSLSIERKESTIWAAVSKTLPASVLLGRDSPGLMRLLNTGKKPNHGYHKGST